MEKKYLVRCEPDQAESIYRLILANKDQMTAPIETLSFAEFKEAVFDQTAYFYWCADGKVLAVVWLGTVAHQPRAAEFGVIALKGGEGHGREAAKAILDYGFGSFGLHRMFCMVNADNERCLKAIEKFKILKREGRLRAVRFKNGSFIDVIVFSILANESRT